MVDRIDPTRGNTYVIDIRNCGVVQIGDHNILNHEACGTQKNLESEATQLNVVGSNHKEEAFENKFDLVPFVGRTEECKLIKSELLAGNSRLIQLCGLTMVGKKRLAEQVIGELVKESYSTKHIPCANVTSWDSFLLMIDKVCNLHIDNSVDSYVNECLILSSLKENYDCLKPVLLFSNCERFISRKMSCDIEFQDCSRVFQAFLISLLTRCPNTRVVVTSQYHFNFDSLSMDIKVNPLTETEAVCLLKKLLPGIWILLSPHIEVVTRKCYGLPSFIFDAACLIKNNFEMDYFKTEELEYLLDDQVRFERMHGHRNNDTQLADYFPGLTQSLQQLITDLSIFRGSFGWKSIKAVLVHTNGINFPRVKDDILFLCRNSMIQRIGDTHKMCIHPIVQSYTKHVLSRRVTCNDVVRLRFVNLFGNVLIRANSEMYLKSQQTVYGYLRDDWLNMEQVLTEAIHCTENTYQAFLEVASEAGNLLIDCFSSEALEFYKTMVGAAERFGSISDVAVMRAHLGQVMTVNSGANLDDAYRIFKQALNVLNCYGPRKALVSLLKNISLNLHKSGNYRDALRYCTRALDIIASFEVDLRVMHQIISIRAMLAIHRISLGNLKTAEALIFESLELAHAHTPYHSAIYVMLNSLGLLYDIEGKNDSIALKYYKSSLAIRRKYEMIDPGKLIIPLANIALQYSAQGRHTRGLRCLEEAYGICKRVGNEDKTALTLWYMGRVFVRLGKFKKALEVLVQATKIYNIHVKHHGIHIHLRLVMSHCYVALNNMNDSRRCLMESLKHGSYFIEQTPKLENYLLTLGHLIMLIQTDKKVLADTLMLFIRESNRLMDKSGSKFEKSQKLKQILHNAEQCFRQLSTYGFADVSFINAIHDICSECGNITKGGYNSEYFWQQAIVDSANKAILKTKLVNSVAIQSAKF